MRTKKNREKLVSLTPEDIEPRNVKERITIFLDQDVIHHAKKMARGKGYQTFINETLRDAFFGEVDQTKIIKQLEKILAVLTRR